MMTPARSGPRQSAAWWLDDVSPRLVGPFHASEVRKRARVNVPPGDMFRLTERLASRRPMPLEEAAPYVSWLALARNRVMGLFLAACVPIARAERRDARAVLSEELARAAMLAKVAGWLLVVAWLVSHKG